MAVRKIQSHNLLKLLLATSEERESALKIPAREKPPDVDTSKILLRPERVGQ